MSAISKSSPNRITKSINESSMLISSSNLDKNRIIDKINELKKALDSGQIINDRLQVMNRGGLKRIYWCFLKLLSPFYRLFGKDVFSHVRIHRVANRMLEYCKINAVHFTGVDKTYKAEFPKNRAIVPPELVVFKNDIIDRLIKKSKNKKNLDKIKGKFRKAIQVYEARKAFIDPCVNLKRHLRRQRNIPFEQKQEIKDVIDHLANCSKAKLHKQNNQTVIKFYQTCPFTDQEKIVYERRMTGSLFDLTIVNGAQPIALTEDKFTLAISRLEQRSIKTYLIDQIRGNPLTVGRATIDNFAISREQKEGIRTVLECFSKCDEAKIYKELDLVKIKFFRNCPWTNRIVEINQIDISNFDFFKIRGDLPQEGINFNLDKLNRGLSLARDQNSKSQEITALQEIIEGIDDDDDIVELKQEVTDVLNAFNNCDIAKIQRVEDETKVKFYRDCPWLNREVLLREVNVESVFFLTRNSNHPIPMTIERFQEAMDLLQERIANRKIKERILLDLSSKKIDASPAQVQEMDKVCKAFFYADLAILAGDQLNGTISFFSKYSWNQEIIKTKEFQVFDFLLFRIDSFYDEHGIELTVPKISKGIEFLKKDYEKYNRLIQMKKNSDKLQIRWNKKKEIRNILDIYDNHNSAKFHKDENGERTVRFYDHCPWTGEKTLKREEKVNQSFFFTEDKDGQIVVILILKKIIGEGARGKARLCVNLSTQERFIRKKVTADEKTLFDVFEKEDIKGVPQVFSIRSTIFNEKKQIIQKEYDGDLTKMRSKLTPKERVSAVWSLIKTLRDLHRLKSLGNDECGFSHKDLKPGNVFISKNNGEVETVIADFNGSTYMSMTASTGYQSPEKVKTYEKIVQHRKGIKKNIEVINENKPFGFDSDYRNIATPERLLERFELEKAQKSDVWSLGLVILYLLDDKFDDGFPPLLNYRQVLKKSLEDSRQPNTDLFHLGMVGMMPDANKPQFRDIGIGDISQRLIDEDMQVLRRSSPQYEQIYNAIDEMLKVDPRERCCADLAYIRFCVFVQQK